MFEKLREHQLPGLKTPLEAAATGGCIGFAYGVGVGLVVNNLDVIQTHSELGKFEPLIIGGLAAVALGHAFGKDALHPLQSNQQ
jgi:hypothetical protein